MTGSIQEEITEQFARMYDDLLLKVVKQVLGRDPVIPDDIRQFSLIRRTNDLNNFMNQTIAYQGVEIGKIKFEFEGVKWTITFEPFDKYK